MAGHVGWVDLVRRNHIDGIGGIVGGLYASGMTADQLAEQVARLYSGLDLRKNY